MRERGGGRRAGAPPQPSGGLGQDPAEHLGEAPHGVVGGLLGNQVGSGSGRTAASVAGAVAGGIAGRQLERNVRREQRYEVVIRYANSGATQTLQFENDPGFRQGDRVRVNNGVLVRDQ